MGPSKAGFAAYYRMFRAMLSDTNLASGAGWLAKARTWRLALLQEPDGGYSPTEGLAGVVSAADDADDDILAADVDAMMAAIPKKLLELAGLNAKTEEEQAAEEAAAKRLREEEDEESERRQVARVHRGGSRGNHVAGPGRRRQAATSAGSPCQRRRRRRRRRCG